jgi:hypothetical protein
MSELFSALLFFKAISGDQSLDLFMVSKARAKMTSSNSLDSKNIVYHNLFQTAVEAFVRNHDIDDVIRCQGCHK